MKGTRESAQTWRALNDFSLFLLSDGNRFYFNGNKLFYLEQNMYGPDIFPSHKKCLLMNVNVALKQKDV